MYRSVFIYLALLSLSSVCPESTSPAPASPQPRADDADVTEDPPEGYYAFVESPHATPPRVRPPPYRQVASDCEELHTNKPHVTANNLCGDLNRGIIPRNPMMQNPNGEPYPFELIRNQTLRFLSRALPVLRADAALPRVAHLQQLPQHTQHTQHTPAYDDNVLGERDKRSVESSTAESESAADHHPLHEPRESKRFCDGGGVFCMLYRAINGESSSTAASGVERREDPGPNPHPSHPRYEGPPTPCPARVEYATPVFARNYQGVWRYVVQIPYEGYFTQTVELTRCMSSRCHYLEGGCLSSPRWVSLLVAELHYPPPAPAAAPAAAAAAPAAPATSYTTSNPQNFNEYQQYIQKRAGVAESEPSTDKPAHCDGHDEMGCYQVRLYYDWFLVPGSCKCWRPDYFARYVRRRQPASPEL